tara:strand:+ start:6332 stop:6610 length:279 start_codon:yes stop_codon:yes gene_type:complete
MFAAKAAPTTGTIFTLCSQLNWAGHRQLLQREFFSSVRSVVQMLLPLLVSINIMFAAKAAPTTEIIFLCELCALCGSNAFAFARVYPLCVRS